MMNSSKSSSSKPTILSSSFHLVTSDTVTSAAPSLSSYPSLASGPMIGSVVHTSSNGMQPQSIIIASTKNNNAKKNVSLKRSASKISLTENDAFIPLNRTSSGDLIRLDTDAISSHNNNTSTAAAATATITNINLPPLRRDGQQLTDKKLRRLEKNRISARECRRKKREAAQNMEREINVLESENLRLRLQLQIGDEAEESIQHEQERVTEQLDLLLKSRASESEIYEQIEFFKEKFADYGRDRRSAIEFHLKNVKRLLMPTSTTSVAIRALSGGLFGGETQQQHQQQSPVSSSESEMVTLQKPPSDPITAIATIPPLEPKALFHYLVQYLEVTPEQAMELKDSRQVAKELDSVLAEVMNVLQQLRQLLTQCNEDLEHEFSNVRSILTPTQAAKFLVWVANNSACMHMLNELWSKVYQAEASNNIDDSVEGGGVKAHET